MAVNRIVIDAPPAAVFDVLADARSYGYWVVGSSQTWPLTDDWPAPGATFQHIQGFFGKGLKDTTSVLESDPPRRLVMEVRARPMLVAKVDVSLAPRNGGTEVSMLEKPLSGIATRVVPRFVLERMIWLRNLETLRRLKRLAEERARP